MLTDAYSDWVCRWVAEQLEAPGAFQARAHGIAVVYKDKPVAGVVYHDWTDSNVYMSIATTSPYWASKLTLRQLFGYAFNQMGVKRVTVVIRGGNRKWRKTLINRFGFVPECKLEDWFPDCDGYQLRMKRSECKWIDHEQRWKQQRAAV